MARTVFCRYFQKTLDGLEAPPFPGTAGQAIFEGFSKAAWEAWLAHQTMLINERHLNLMDPDARSYLNEQRRRFLEREGVDAAEGYVPPEA
jgi:Fe-S cluster biosynthesis and repair protein YggX